MKKIISQILAGLTVFALVLSLASIAKATRSTTVTICHSTGSNSNPYIQQHPSASGDVDGHNDHNGGVFPADPWGDIIPPFDYDEEHYSGKNWNTAGQAIWENDCAVPTPPTDLCENVVGTQETLPAGYVATDQDNICACATGYEAYYGDDDNLICTPIETPTDLCSNLDGNQTTIPDGYEDPNEDMICTLIEETTDVCPNIDGNQREIPEGLIKDENGNCVEPENEDLCPNIAGTQLTIPNHYFIDDQGNCSRTTSKKKKVVVTPQVLGASTTVAEPENLPVGGGDGLSVILSLAITLILISISAITFESLKLLPSFMNAKK